MCPAALTLHGGETRKGSDGRSGEFALRERSGGGFGDETSAAMTIADALTQRGKWPDVADESGREILSWLVVASLLETHADLGVVETHPGHPGEYDCLSVYDRTRMDRGPILDLDRLGVAHIAPLAGGADTWDDFWTDCAQEGPVAVTGRLRMRAGLGAPQAHSGAEAFAVSQIARRLLKLHLSNIEGTWECRNGVADASGGPERRLDLFAQLPAAAERLESAPPHPLGDPAYSFWFLLRDGVAVSCLDTFR